MRKGFASLTATVVASARALAKGSPRALVDPHDDVARRLLPAALRLALRALQDTRPGQRVLSPLLSRASLGLVDHLALRSAAIDALLCAALESGVRQVAIVGAGLDARAHRLDTLRDATLYEVDHPDSQRVKRARAAGLAVTARALRYVAVDLAAEPLGPALTHAGFDAQAPSFVIVEGLLLYLTRGQTEALLEQLSMLSANGSQLVLSYTPADAPWLRHARWVVASTLAAIGEPLGEPPTRGELAQLVTRAGFTIVRDATPAEMLSEVGTDATQRAEPRVAYERLLHARR